MKLKSIIELELIKIVQLKKTGYPLPNFDDIRLAIQKALKELKKKRFCKTHDGLGEDDYCGLAEGKCVFVYRESDVEKCFGEVENATDKTAINHH